MFTSLKSNLWSWFQACLVNVVHLSGGLYTPFLRSVILFFSGRLIVPM